MKQYWRVGTVRTLASLGLGMLVLGKQYYQYFPILQNMSLIGALLLGTALFFFFLGVGWLYDQKAIMWAQKRQAIEERNPYQYVPNIKSSAQEYPIFYNMINTTRAILQKIEHSTKSLDDLAFYFDNFFRTKPQKHDILCVRKKATEYLQTHKFHELVDESASEVSFLDRVKLTFETQNLRLIWIQSLTGLLQDVLIFGILYVAILYPDVPSGLELLYGVLGISFPLLILLLIIGWYYDKKLQVWSADTAVKVERNPYSYVVEPFIIARIIPFFYTFLITLREVLIKKSEPIPKIDDYLKYLRKYIHLSASKTEDLREAVRLRKSLGTLFVINENRS